MGEHLRRKGYLCHGGKPPYPITIVMYSRKARGGHRESICPLPIQPPASPGAHIPCEHVPAGKPIANGVCGADSFYRSVIRVWYALRRSGQHKICEHVLPDRMTVSIACDSDRFHCPPFGCKKSISPRNAFAEKCLLDIVIDKNSAPQHQPVSFCSWMALPEPFTPLL